MCVCVSNERISSNLKSVVSIFYFVDDTDTDKHSFVFTLTPLCSPSLAGNDTQKTVGHTHRPTYANCAVRNVVVVFILMRRNKFDENVSDILAVVPCAVLSRDVPTTAKMQ